MLKSRQTGSKCKYSSDVSISFIAVFIIISYPTLTASQDSIQFDAGWVMQTGDNRAWANPHVDDGEWQAIQVGVPWEEAA